MITVLCFKSHCLLCRLPQIWNGKTMHYHRFIRPSLEEKKAGKSNSSSHHDGQRLQLPDDDLEGRGHPGGGAGGRRRRRGGGAVGAGPGGDPGGHGLAAHGAAGAVQPGQRGRGRGDEGALVAVGGREAAPAAGGGVEREAGHHSQVTLNHWLMAK